MKISTRGRYALRLMLDLALCPAGTPVCLRDIARRQEISEKYLEIILRMLVKGKLVKGLRGKGGGYVLTREPEDYLVGEIIELTEGPIACVACRLPDAEVCPRKENCITLPLWEKYDALVHEFFFGITLKDLMEGRF